MVECSLWGAKHQLVGWCLLKTILYRLADKVIKLLLKCYDFKMVKLPGCSSIGASSCSKPTKKKKNIKSNGNHLINYVLKNCINLIRNISIKNRSGIDKDRGVIRSY